jgi:ketosteroid isomerase-like protein
LKRCGNANSAIGAGRHQEIAAPTNLPLADSVFATSLQAMKLRSAVLSSILVCVAGCAAITPASIVENFNRNATATAVRESVEHFHESLRKRDVDAILGCFLADTSFRAYDGDEGWLTYDNIRLQDVPAFRRLKSVEIHIDSLSISVLSPSAAVVSNNLLEAFTDSAGHTQRLRVTQTMVWTRVVDGWKIAHLHSSERSDSTKLDR